jgi:hypothetical protein
VQRLEIRLTHDGLAGGDPQGVGPTARFVRPLPVRPAAEDPGPARPGKLVEGAVAPATQQRIR